MYIILTEYLLILKFANYENILDSDKIYLILDMIKIRNLTI
jgi:hypothetical protein